jgi:hypothetical protein
VKNYLRGSVSHIQTTLISTGVPVILAVSGDPTARTLIMTSVIFLNNVVLVLAVVGPKIHALWHGIDVNMTTTGGTDIFEHGGTRSIMDYVTGKSDTINAINYGEGSVPRANGSVAGSFSQSATGAQGTLPSVRSGVNKTTQINPTFVGRLSRADTLAMM